MNKLLRFDNEQLYVCFDFETCHVNLLADNYPWQLGMIICNNKEILEKHNYYIYWDDILKKISVGARNHTRFNYEVYSANAQPQDKVLDIFESYLYDNRYLKFGHNLYHFDIFIHNQWRRLNNKESDYSYLNKTIDTDAIARAWKIGIKDISREEWKASMFKYGNYKEKGMKTALKYLGPEFNIEYDYTTLHDGLNDCILNHHVFKQLIYKVNI